jgi:ribosomal protein S27AE
MPFAPKTASPRAQSTVFHWAHLWYDAVEQAEGGAMMKCPHCGRQTSLSYQANRMICTHCGWGTEGFSPETAPGRRRASRVRRADVSVVAVVVQLVVAAAIVGGLYWIVFTACGSQRTTGNILYFAAGIVVYAAAGWVLRPSVDPEKLGVFGNMWMDNPFSMRDDIERFKLWFLVLTFPGRIIAGAVVSLLRLCRPRT